MQKGQWTGVSSEHERLCSSSGLEDFFKVADKIRADEVVNIQAELWPDLDEETVTSDLAIALRECPYPSGEDVFEDQ